MLQFLPMIMSLLQGQKDEKQAQNQNEVSALMGQAPTGGGAEKHSGGGLGGVVNGLSGMLQQKGPGAGAVDKIEHGNTEDMLDDSFGKMSDKDKDDEDLLSM